MYENLGNNILFISSVVLILCLLFPILITLFIITHHKKLAPRIKIKDSQSGPLLIHLKIQDQYYEYPVVDISRTGLCFRVDSIPEKLILEHKMPLEFCIAEHKLFFDLDSKLIYLRSDDYGHHFHVGVQFRTPLDNQTLFNIIEHNDLAPEFKLLTKQLNEQKNHKKQLGQERKELIHQFNESVIYRHRTKGTHLSSGKNNPTEHIIDV